MLSNHRRFNTDNVLNENQGLPDCSGEIETTTALYTDIIEVGLDTFAVVFELIESIYLDFKLQEATVLQPN